MSKYICIPCISNETSHKYINHKLITAPGSTIITGRAGTEANSSQSADTGGDSNKIFYNTSIAFDTNKILNIKK